MSDPIRLLDGGLLDGETPSPEMLELLGTLRGAVPAPERVAAIRSGAVSRGSWGRWLVPLAILLAGSAPWMASSDAREPEAATLDPGTGALEAASPDLTPPAVAEDAITSLATSGETARAGVEDAIATSAARGDVVTEEPPVRAASRAERRARAHRDPREEAATDAAAVAGDDVPASAAVLGSGDPDMTFDLGDSGAPAEEVDAPPSETWAMALSEYARGCCDCALTPLQRVIEGSTDDAPRAVRRAELLLGICLSRLGWDQSARTVLDGIVESGAEHPYFSEALGELARLSPRLPDPSVLVASFRHDDEARLVTESDAAARDAAAYFQGRARYEDAELERAASTLSTVSSASPFHRAARFYEGLSEVRLRHAGRAEAAFRAVMDESPEGDRFRDMALLALARLYYAAAESRRADGDDEREGELLAQALEAWRRVPVSSEQFLDAFFEESWALYLAGDDSRALGHVFGLLSPFFEDTEHPEAYVVRGTIHFEHCLYDEAEADVRDFHARYDAVLPALDALLDLGDEDAIALHDGRAGSLEGAVRSLVAPSILDRDALRRSEHARSIEGELDRVAGAAFGDGPLGARLSSELSVELSIARTRLADGVRERLRSVRDALVARMNEIDTIALETTTARRDVLTGDAVLSEESRREAEIIADLGVEVWPFDGEYWQDEVVSYREVVRDRCGR